RHVEPPDWSDIPRAGVTFGLVKPRFRYGEEQRAPEALNWRPESVEISNSNQSNTHIALRNWLPLANVTRSIMTRIGFLASVFCAAMLCHSCSCGSSNSGGGSSCGGPGQACCTTGTPCNSNAVCRNGVCAACGGTGEVCCSMTTCGGGGCCVNGYCVGSGQSC